MMAAPPVPLNSEIPSAAQNQIAEWRVSKYPVPPNHARKAVSVIRLNGETCPPCPPCTPACPESRPTAANTCACLSPGPPSSKLRSTRGPPRSVPILVAATHRACLPRCASPRSARCDSPRDHPPEIRDEL